MSSQTSELRDESLRVNRCRHGDLDALAELRQTYQSSLFNILLARGATRTEAEDLLADIWADCVPGDEDRPSLLDKFSGKCLLLGWLATLATNRWIDWKRRQARMVDASSNGRDQSAPSPLERMAAPAATASESTLVTLLRESLKAAFAACRPEARVLLRLVYLHDLTQREIVQMLGWSESKVSRFLSSAMEEIEKHTLRELKNRDPWLELSWQDFVDLCETHQVGFL